MTNTKHTPRHDVIYLIDTGDEIAWCDCPDPTGYEDPQDATKYLRATPEREAAPELLEALCDMVSDRAELSKATIEFAERAIAKARGVSVAIVASRSSNPIQQYANSSLIAAAPEQNAALQCLVDTVCALLADGSIKIPDERLQWLERAAREGERVLDKARGLS